MLGAATKCGKQENGNGLQILILITSELQIRMDIENFIYKFFKHFPPFFLWHFKFFFVSIRVIRGQKDSVDKDFVDKKEAMLTRTAPFQQLNSN